MFNNELMADVHFLVGQPGGTERLPGHRVRLSSRSPGTTAAFVAAATINKQPVTRPNVVGLHLISIAPSHTCVHTCTHTQTHAWLCKRSD